MMLMIVGILCMMFGYMILFLTDMFPLFRMVYFHWFATIFFILPYIYTLYRLKAGGCYRQADSGLPKWKHLVYYLRRDNQVIPLVGERAFPGESFIDIPELGLMEFLGKDCVYNWGDKKIVWGLENVNFTPDPRYFNFNHLLWSVGFSNSDHVKTVLSGGDLEAMGNIYINMLNYDKETGVRKLVQHLESYDKKTVDFTPKKKELDHDKIIAKMDKLWR